MQLIKNTKIDFISKARITIFLSIGIILAGIISLIINGGPNLSIDFKGGTVFQISTEKSININELREQLGSTNLANAEITEITGLNVNQEFRIKANIDNTTIASDMILNTLSAYNPEIRSIENVGPKVGKELQTQAITAISLALLMLMIYIALRFDSFYSLGSVVAIIHDVLVTLGIFSLLNLEINLSIIAAFLTIVGYSLNDTIVIFDRFRENSQKDLKLSMVEIANLSLNQTLSRTVVTSLTTLIVVCILYFLGGEVIRYFAFALIIGVIVGTYSSIFIASPFMLFIKSKMPVAEED